jgi:hypothetical protein
MAGGTVAVKPVVDFRLLHIFPVEKCNNNMLFH